MNKISDQGATGAQASPHLGALPGAIWSEILKVFRQVRRDGGARARQNYQDPFAMIKPLTA
jgi:hypothetical protein